MSKVFVAICLAALLTATLVPVGTAAGRVVCQDESAQGRTSPPSLIFVWGSHLQDPMGPHGLVQGVDRGAETAAGKGSLYFPEAMLKEIQQEAAGNRFMVDSFSAVYDGSGLSGIMLYVVDTAGTCFAAQIQLDQTARVPGRYFASLQLHDAPTAQMDGAILVVSAAEGPMP